MYTIHIIYEHLSESFEKNGSTLLKRTDQIVEATHSKLSILTVIIWVKNKEHKFTWCIIQMYSSTDKFTCTIVKNTMITG